MHRLRCAGGLALVLVAVACATTPRAPEPGTGSVWGTVSLDPHAGVEPSRSSGAYGDRRMDHTELVDYSRPGFAVVYLDAPASRGESVHVDIRDTRVSTRIEPAYAVLALGGELAVTNASRDPRTLSCPAAELIRRLEPGESAAIPIAAEGEYSIYLLDVPGAVSTVLVTGGVHTVASDAGSWELRDLPPGRYQLHTWHPRFPPTSRWVDLAPDALVRVDIELGVEHRDEVSDVAP